MKKIFILLTSMFLLVGCIESMALLGGGAANGKLVQSSIQTVVSYGVKERTGKSPIGHAINYVKEEKTSAKKESCSSFIDKKDLEICLMVEKRIVSKQVKTKEKKFSHMPSRELASSLQLSINEKSKIKYLD